MTERDIAQVALTRAAAELAPEARITGEKIAAAVEVMRAHVLEGAIPLRGAYLRAKIDNVEVDDEEARIYGRRTVLERLVMGDGVAPAGVPSFVRKWRGVSFPSVVAELESRTQRSGHQEKASRTA
jgi:site-specific DNA recombinase